MSAPKRPHEVVTRDDFYSPSSKKTLRRPHELARDPDGIIYGSDKGLIGNNPYIRSICAHNEVTRAAGEMIRPSPLSRAKTGDFGVLK